MQATIDRLSGTTRLVASRLGTRANMRRSSCAASPIGRATYLTAFHESSRHAESPTRM
jgi:hypothetical protein